MENYVGLVVYLWGIWGGIDESIDVVTGILGCALFASTLFYFIATEPYDEDSREIAKKYSKMLWKPFITMWILAILVPSKENMLLIISANPVIKTITESAKDGKLSKLSQLTDMALDDAIAELKK